MGKMKRVIIFGCGGVAVKAKEKLEKEQYEIIAFTDNNRDLWNREFQGKTVIPIANILLIQYDCIAIGVYKAAKIIKAQLLDMGIPDEKIMIPIEPVRIFRNPLFNGEDRLDALSEKEYQSDATLLYQAKAVRVTDQEFLDKLEKLKTVLMQNDIPREKVCIVSGAVLQAYGLRESKKFDDIDIIMTSDLREVYGTGLVIVSESAEMHPQNEYDISDDEIIGNMRYHFIFQDMKFMNLDILCRKVAIKNKEEAELIKKYLG